MLTTYKIKKTAQGVTLIAIIICAATLAVLALTREVSAQADPGGQTTGTSAAALGSPDCAPNWTVVGVPVPDYNVNNQLRGIAAVSSNDIWAVGFYTRDTGYLGALTEHWNGSAWSTVTSGQHSYDTYLNGVAAIASDRVWAVGAYCVDDACATQHTFIEHWDGSAWSGVTSPNPAGAYNILNAVAAVGAGDVWAVGSLNYGNNGVFTLIEHWDGSGWSVVPDPDPGYNDALNGVTAVSANNVWAVGDYTNGSDTITYPFIEHWNGSAWSIVTSPNLNNAILNAVAAVSANNVWAVGTGLVSRDTLIEHWNGTQWSRVTSPNPGSNNGLDAVTALSANNVWAVGYTGSSPLAEHFDGNTWSAHSMPPAPNSTYNELFGVAATSASNILAVGENSHNAWVRPLAERYNPCATPTPTRAPTRTRTPTRTNTPLPFPTQCAINFADVPNPSTFYPYVQCLACRGIISGFACGGTNEPCDPNNDPYFRPHDDVSRGQLAKIVARSAQINIPVSGQTFEDVPPGSAFYTYTEQLHNLGVMGGYACGGTNYPCVPPLNRPYFRPHNSATRAQLAKIDSNTAGYNDIPTLQVFEDIPAGSTYYTYTYRLAARNIMSGYTCGGANEPCVPPRNRPYFRPNNNVSRGQTSKIVANTFYPNCQAP